MRILKFAVATAFTITTACGGGASSLDNTLLENSTQQTTNPTEINGGGIKGPLAHATVSLFELDTMYENLFDINNPIVVGNTDANASIQNLTLPAGSKLPVVLLVDGTNAIDLITGKSPVIKKLVTIITSTHLVNQTPIYATPLSTLSYKVAANTLKNSNSTGLSEAFERANDIVLSTFNFGVNSSFHTLFTPPIFDKTIMTESQQETVADYRAINEAFASVAYRVTNQLRTSGEDNVSEDIVLAQLAEDIGADLVIDNQAGGRRLELGLDLSIIQEQALDLTIPNSDIAVRGISQLLESELHLNNTTVDFALSGYIPSLEQATLSADIDGDGILNVADTSNVNSIVEGRQTGANLPTDYLNPPIMVSDFSRAAGSDININSLVKAFSSADRKMLASDGINRLEIVERNGRHWLQQRFEYTPGEKNYGLGSTGSQFRVEIPGNNHDEIYVSFDIELPADIVLTRHGKFGPGLLGGPEVTTGGNASDGYNGFSIRNLFNLRDFGSANDRYPQGTGAIYAYYVDQPNDTGESIPSKIGSTPQLWNLGGVTSVQIRVKMNTPETAQGRGDGRKDGILQVWYNGNLVMDLRDMRYRHDNDIHIDDFFYSAFYGGGSDIFSTTKEEMVWFGDIAVSDKPLLYNPPR